MSTPTRDIYLDANATTRVLPKAAAAAMETMEDLFGNPSSSHVAGLRARGILTKARESALRALGATRGRIVFTSGATEAIQTAIFSALCAIRERTPATPADRLLLYGATEHKAVPQALKHWAGILGLPHEILPMPVDARGRIDLDFLADHAARADLVCTMAVNNETGVIHDLAAIERTIRQAHPAALWLVDAVQAVAKHDLQLATATIDYAPVSGHKLYAPKGIGFLYVRDGAPLKPLMAGGGQESGARGGTENLPGVAALAAVFETMESAGFQVPAALAGFRDRLVASLTRAFPNIVFNTPFEISVPTVVNFAVPGLSSKELLDLFDAADIRVSSGSACGSALVGSYVLEAMGLPRWRSDGAIRLSFGPLATPFEIGSACARIEEAGRALRASCLIVREEHEAPNEMTDGLVQLKRGSMCSWIHFDAKSATAVIIDPFAELADRIETLVRCQDCKVRAILDTHLHVDHDSCRDDLLRRLDKLLLPSARTRDPLGWPETTCEVTVGTGEVVPAIPLGARDVLARVDLPGHTVVGHALLLGQPVDGYLGPHAVRFAFTGDTLLIGGIGRTDFHSSSGDALYQSIRRLPLLLGPASVICPTHDYHNGFATTLDSERAGNSFLARMLDPETPMTLEEFHREKPLLDQGIDDASNAELVCGNIAAPCQSAASLAVAPEGRREFFERHRGARVIDVREPHEFRFVRDWQALGLLDAPRNVPLTRFAEFLHHLLADHPDRSRLEVICLCRSGDRSARVVEVLRRCGVERTWNLTGGLALGGSSSFEELDAGYAI
jgi:cysteine sulfinate desulfinase/cysteine desulfurase-like protein/glyoxylase-like metal-dependent hydrolase (beta-lactamase superfamily II)/rhodanese-related sulfurtransferase